jgi:hypothetical protein
LEKEKKGSEEGKEKRFEEKRECMEERVEGGK